MRVGIDLTNSERFLKKTKSFYTKYFLQSEIDYAKTKPSFEDSIAGIFACKEAFLKAVGIGVFKGIELSNIEISHDKNGNPFVYINKLVKREYKIKSCEISLSHEKGMVVAICIIN